MLNKAWKVIERDNGTISIYGNGHVRELLDICQLEISEIPDWIPPEEYDHGYSFFRYKGEVYCTCDFPRIDQYAPNWMKEFDGQHGDSFFSGILIKYVMDEYNDYGVKVYTYIC